jgi:RluA family pseudouridine synthase
MQTFSYARHQNVETLIEFLVRRFPYQSESDWRSNILNQEIKVNDKNAKPNLILRSRDIISYDRPREKEPPVDESYEVLYEDPHIIVVDKNGNIPLSESGRYHKNNLINILKEREGYPELYAVHRLDKETSGVVLIAREKKIATLLGQQFVKHIPEKHYNAILVGEMKEKQVLVDLPLKKKPKDIAMVKIRQIVDHSGKPSKTMFFSKRTANGLTLARIRTFSGRTHQIRCHAEYIGYPILGDKLYGQSDSFFVKVLNKEQESIFPPFGKIERQLLHAVSLKFIHPVTEREMTIQSDFDKQLPQIQAITDLTKG